MDGRFSADNAPGYSPELLAIANQAFEILGDGLDELDFDDESESTRLGLEILAAIDAGAVTLGAILCRIRRAAGAAARQVSSCHPTKRVRSH